MQQQAEFRKAQALTFKQIRELAPLDPPQRLEKVLAIWDTQLVAEDDNWWVNSQAAFECARRLSRFGDAVDEWAKLRMEQAVSLNERAQRATVLMHLGHPFPRDLVVELQNGSAQQKLLVDHLNAVADFSGLVVE